MKCNYLTANEVTVLMYLFVFDLQIDELWANGAKLSLFSKDLIKCDNEEKIYITEKGKAMIDGILGVQEPVQKWVVCDYIIKEQS